MEHKNKTSVWRHFYFINYFTGINLRLAELFKLFHNFHHLRTFQEIDITFWIFLIVNLIFRTNSNAKCNTEKRLFLVSSAKRFSCFIFFFPNHCLRFVSEADAHYRIEVLFMPAKVVQIQDVLAGTRTSVRVVAWRIITRAWSPQTPSSPPIHLQYFSNSKTFLFW